MTANGHRDGTSQDTRAGTHMTRPGRAGAKQVGRRGSNVTCLEERSPPPLVLSSRAKAGLLGRGDGLMGRAKQRDEMQVSARPSLAPPSPSLPSVCAPSVLIRPVPTREKTPKPGSTMRPSAASSIVLLQLACAAGLAVGAPGRRAVVPPRADHGRAQQVKKAFEISWNGYFKHAFPHDTLHPVTNGYGDDRAAWGVTVVDALSTAIVMNSLEIVQPMLDHIAGIDFGTTAEAGYGISLFETNIRYLGGLLSGYDLLTGPYKQLGAEAEKVDALLRQAQSLADSLSVAFDTPSGIPDGTVFLNPARKNSGSEYNNIAEIGTLVLEWTRLSDLTGNRTYAQLVQRAERYLLRPTGKPEAWPGLVGTFVSTKNGTFLDSQGGWGGGDDSFYEYLIKMYVYDPAAFGEYRDRWVAAVDSTIDHLLSHPTSRSDLTFLSGYNGRKTNPSSGH
ncbi:hypothetical protein E4U53_002288, partial [Claviceps sorghi]